MRRPGPPLLPPPQQYHQGPGRQGGSYRILPGVPGTLTGWSLARRDVQKRGAALLTGAAPHGILRSVRRWTLARAGASGQRKTWRIVRDCPGLLPSNAGGWWLAGGRGSAPEGRKRIAPRRKPGVRHQINNLAPEGRKKVVSATTVSSFLRPSGAIALIWAAYPRFTPGATLFRPSGAENRAY